MANAKAFASGEILPVMPKYPASLGAPFVANWNDYPSPGEGNFFWFGVLAFFFGMFTGSNLTVLSAHLLSAGSFYFVARVLRYRREVSLAGAVLFSLSCYAFIRGLSHIGPSFYWHIPLGLLAVWWCGGRASFLKSRKKVLFCMGVAIIYGVQDPYFSGLLLQFLVLSSIICLIRRESWSRIVFPLFIALITFATCVLMNVDTFYDRLLSGPNETALIRNYRDLEVYALKPVELFLPLPHRLDALQGWVREVYISKALFFGEIGSPYLGIVGILAFGALIWTTAHAVINRNKQSIPSHFWLVLWVLLYSVVGGGNGALGLFGFTFFRGTNRYSIVILAILLLFLVRQLTVLTRRWTRPAISALAVSIILVGLFDQTPRPPTSALISDIRRQVLSDRRFAFAMEAALPPRAMVFQLPVWPFPEGPAIRQMRDYEHFRPYLHSRSLRFSYGSVKGRARERWQAEAVQLGPAYLVGVLESYGFSAIMINKKAYDAEAASLRNELVVAGRSEVLCESDDLVCIRLHPAANPILPPEFDRNWFALQGDANDHWKWSPGDASIILYNGGPTARQLRLSFSLGTLHPREISVSHGTQELFHGSLTANQPPLPVNLMVLLPPGRSELRFHTNLPGQVAGNGDGRILAFNLRNLTIRE
jgi:hypothetical protein